MSRRRNDGSKYGRKLTWLLRHGAKEKNVAICSQGYVSVDDIMNLPDFKGLTMKEIQKIHDEDKKQRFHLKTEDGVVKIRANQGHTISLNMDMEEIVTPEPICVHGTYKNVLEPIMKEGLKPMQREYIHMAKGLPKDQGVISGMRGNCNVIIYIDMKEAMKDGIKFFRSQNNVILSRGNKGGTIPSKYFSKVVDRKTGEILS